MTTFQQMAANAERLLDPGPLWKRADRLLAAKQASLPPRRPEDEEEEPGFIRRHPYLTAGLGLGGAGLGYLLYNHLANRGAIPGVAGNPGVRHWLTGSGEPAGRQIASGLDQLPDQVELGGANLTPHYLAGGLAAAPALATGLMGTGGSNLLAHGIRGLSALARMGDGAPPAAASAPAPAKMPGGVPQRGTMGLGLRPPGEVPPPQTPASASLFAGPGEGSRLRLGNPLPRSAQQLASETWLRALDPGLSQGK